MESETAVIEKGAAGAALRKVARPVVFENKNEISELTSTPPLPINGYEAFNTGNYKLAAEQLSKQNTNFRTSDKAVSAYMKLAEQAFKSRDYYTARKLIAKAFALLPTKLISDIYNMAVADWHYRHYDKDRSHDFDDDLQWQKLIQVIFDNKHLVPKDNAVIILETAKAMHDDSYDGNGNLIPRHK